jgi:hypothetical protein
MLNLQYERRMKMDIEIITDHKWKDFKYAHEVPLSVIEDYDYLSENENFDGWIHYRKRWYHTSDFIDCTNIIYSPNNPFKKFGYDGYLSDSFFSGVLIKLSECREQYQIATYIS